MAGGRRPKPIWNEFESINQGGTRKAKCKFCSDMLVANPKRMEKHIQGCERAPDNIRSIYIGSETSSSSSSSQGAVKRPKLYQTQLVCHPAVTNQIQQDIEDSLLKALVSSNIAWNIVENAYFKEFVDRLRPNFKLKTRKTFSNTIMSRVSGIVQREEDVLLENAEFLTLICDGKTDISKQNVTNWILCNTAGASLMYEFNSGTPAKNGKAICDDLLEMGRRIQEKTQATLCFVSDSAGSYVKAREYLNLRTDSPFMFAGPCLAHQSNLILKVR